MNTFKNYTTIHLKLNKANVLEVVILLMTYISCEWKCKFDGRKCNSNQKWNNVNVNVSVKKHHICEKNYIWNPATCTCEKIWT